MNYVVAYKKEGKPQMAYFSYRDEVDVAYGPESLVRDEDDVIRIMMTYYHPDDNDFVIRETLIPLKDMSDSKILTMIGDLYVILNGKQNYN
jgi:hypothetical protein